VKRLIVGWKSTVGIALCAAVPAKRPPTGSVKKRSVTCAPPWAVRL
jgi:hypothetical protein